MTPDRLEQLRSFYIAVAHRSPQEREQLLALASAGDPALSIDLDAALAEGQLPPFPGLPVSMEDLSSLWLSFEGEEIDRTYYLRTLIGEGASGGVYRADHIVEGTVLRQVAVKLIRPGTNASDHQLTELASATTLRHPFLLSCYHAGSVTLRRVRLLYLVMELAHDSLASKQGTIRPESLLTCARQMSMALGYLHQLRLIHRDVKPGNILCVGTEWKLADFGTIRQNNDVTMLTQTAVGTPVFMAPETFRGVVSVAGDVWSFGCTLLIALTGSGPYAEQTQQSLVDAIRGTAPVIPAELPEPFATVIRHCLERDPAKRWTMEQVQTALLNAPSGNGFHHDAPPSLDPSEPPTVRTLQGPAPKHETWTGRFRLPAISSLPSIPHLKTPFLQVALAVVGCILLGELLIGMVAWSSASAIRDRLMADSGVTKIWAAPVTVHPGDVVTKDDVLFQLHQAGFTTDRANPNGWFSESEMEVQIFPGPAATATREAAVIEFTGQGIRDIAEPITGTIRPTYLLPAAVVSTRQGDVVTLQSPVSTSEIPEVLRMAISAADAGPRARYALQKLVNAVGPQPLITHLPFGETLLLGRLRQLIPPSDRTLLYANRAEFGQAGGSPIIGVGAASRFYLGKPVFELNLSESALLAGMLASREPLNPAVSPREARTSRDLLLSLLLENGNIQQPAFQAARSQPVQTVLSAQEANLAPPAAALWAMLPDPNVSAATTILPPLQQLAEQQVREIWRRIAPHSVSSPELLLLALDNRNGEVRAAASFGIPSSTAATRLLSPHPGGPALVPFLYAAGFAKSLNPSTAVSNEPFVLTAAEALRQRSEAPARSISSQFNSEALLNLLHFSVAHNDVLQSQISPADLAADYGVLANGGLLFPPRLLAQPASSAQPVLDARAAYIVATLLQSPDLAPSAAPDQQQPPVWFANSRQYLTAVIWMKGDAASGQTLRQEATRSGNQFLTDAFERAHLPAISATAVPAGIVSVLVDRGTGKLALPNCGPPISVPFFAGTEPVEHCSGMQTNGQFTQLATAHSRTLPPGEFAVPPPEPKKKGLFGRLRGVFHKH